ncbi:uncharacterized protein CLUP02_04771 [Colletotrichum lupini]|uniref:Uncharacterized protein n=9 Tax=Colletotrichum acutatum species complex TaxID=2707335 RepID=A0A9Q8SMQ6_9PEZI|nr:uncharacterized protein CLUP02_04771 [Colletotrichum lupini]UQC79292.1 hypothetical protein CLUP02_04771 [Colletotrichum lupini]
MTAATSERQYRFPSPFLPARTNPSALGILLPVAGMVRGVRICSCCPIVTVTGVGSCLRQPAALVRLGLAKSQAAAPIASQGRSVGAKSEAPIYSPLPIASRLPTSFPNQTLQQYQNHNTITTVIMAVSNAIQDLFSSIYELLSSIFNAFYHVLQTIFNTIIGFFTGLVNLITDVFQGAIDVVGGLGKFVLSNFVIIGVIAAGGYAYVRYTSQGRQVATGKKTA